MKFCWCTITVKNMEKSLRFYQDIVGLAIDRRFSAGPNREIVFLGDGETKVELISDLSHKAPNKIEGISLGFEVKSLDQMMGFIKEKGLEIESGPVQPNPHVKFFYLLDPDGVRIQFVENM